jgi:hypothetical protein
MDYIFDTYFYSHFPAYGPRVFTEHNERIRTCALSSDTPYLEFQAGKQGWEDLCQFLEREVPTEKKGEDWPRIHDTEAFRKMFRVGEKWESVKRRLLGVGIVLPVVVFGVLAWRKRAGI